MWWFFSGGVITSIGIIAIEKPFHQLALKSVGLLDTLLDPNEGEEKIQKLQTKIIQAISILFVFIFLCIIVSFPTWSLAEVTAHPNLFDIEAPLESHWDVYLIGSVLPFVGLKFLPKKSDYSSLSQLLHRLILNHYHLGGWMLKKQISAIEGRVQPRALLITGLARAGTTALTKTLAKSSSFKSLDYSNMPFLLYPRFWSKIYKPNNKENKERAHKDGVNVGFASVEALEEYFFKQQLNDSYILPNQLITHSISDEVLDQYQKYQSSIAQSDVYLAKNNNQMLRLNSILKNPNQEVVVLFRNPSQHAYSLLKQHQRFCDQQSKDPFVLEYMNWLGHHEFGLGQKPFAFSKTNNSYDPQQMEFWVSRWIGYYEQALKFAEHEQVCFVPYELFLNEPELVGDHITKKLNIHDGAIQPKRFVKKAIQTPIIDEVLLEKANTLYQELLKFSINI